MKIYIKKINIYFKLLIKNAIKKRQEKIINNLNPYFLDFPISSETEDYFGFESYVDSIYLNIKEKARMIGIIADYGSGKSSVVSLLENKIKIDKKEKKYPIVKINLWTDYKKTYSNSKDAYYIHKKFLFQLAYQLKKNDDSYINKKLNPNYGIMNIVPKNKISKFLIVTIILLFMINIVHGYHLLKYIPIPFEESFIWLRPALSILADFSGVIAFLIGLLLMLFNEIIISFSKGDSKRTITENDSIDVYIDLISKYKNKKNLIIVIEDLDRSEIDCDFFLQQVYSFYSHSSNHNVTFIVAISTKQYFKNTSCNYKIFDYIVDLQKIQAKDYKLVLESLIRKKEDILKKKYNIEITKETIGKWMWLANGISLDIRQLKHRYNDTILQFSVLSERFKYKYIELKSCIAVSYLKNEYPAFFQKLVNESENMTVVEKPIIRNLFNRYIDDEEIDLEALWLQLDEGYIITTENKMKFLDFKNDVLNLLKNKYIQDDLELYFYNFSKGNKIFTSDEKIIYNSYLYDEDKYDNLEETINQVIEKNSSFITIPINRRRELEKKLPEMIFVSDKLFDKVYRIALLDEKNYIFEEMLKLDMQNFNKTMLRLRKIMNLDIVDKNFLDYYVSSITKYFREDNDDIQIITQRQALLSLFFNKREIFLPLYSNSFPLIGKNELDNFNKLSDLHFFISSEVISDNNIDYIFNKINKIYKKKDYIFLVSILNGIQDNMMVKAFNALNMKLNNNEKDNFKERFINRLPITTFNNIKSFIIKIGKSFDDLEKKLIDMVNKETITVKEYCDFINKIAFVSKDTLAFISGDNISYGFNENIQKKMFSNRYYEAYVKSKIKNQNTFSIEKEKEKILRGAYIATFEKSDSETLKLILSSRALIGYYAKLELYESCSENKLIIFSNLPQNYKILSTVLFRLNDINILNHYINNIRALKMNEADIKLLIKNNKEKLNQLDSSAINNLKKLMPNPNLKKSITNYLKKN